MNILLINSVIKNKNFSNISKLEPLGIEYIASTIIHKHNVKLLDCFIKNLDYDSLKNEIKSFEPHIIGISLSYSNILEEYIDLANFIKEHFKNIPIIIGGNLATFLADDLIELRCIDIIVKGEGEFIFKQVLEAIELNNLELLQNIQGVYFKINGNIIKNKGQGYIDNLDILPLPSHFLLDTQFYERTIITSRGCPYNCIYCSSSKFFKKYRTRNLDNVIEEIESLYTNNKQYLTNRVVFADDILNFDLNRLANLCDKLIELNKKLSLNYPITWACSARIENINKDILMLMKSAGCIAIYFGIESASDRILKILKRNYTKEQVLNTIRLCKEIGIYTYTNFIIGLPYETEEDIKQTIDLIEQLPCISGVHFLIPLPGTPIYNEPTKFNLKLLETKDFKLGKILVNNNFISNDRLMELYYKAIGIILYKTKLLKNENFIG